MVPTVTRLLWLSNATSIELEGQLFAQRVCPAGVSLARNTPELTDMPPSCRVELDAPLMAILPAASSATARKCWFAASPYLALHWQLPSESNLAMRISQPPAGGSTPVPKSISPPL